MAAPDIVRSRRARAATWFAFLFVVGAIHSVSAIALSPVVKARISGDCAGWCALDQVIHAVSAGLAALVLLAWTPVLLAASRTAGGTRITGHVQWILAGVLLLVNLLFATTVQAWHWSWFLNIGACLVTIIFGGIAAGSTPNRQQPL
jgi:hypothetical protein